MNQREINSYVKRAIDRQVSGEDPDVFGSPCTIKLVGWGLLPNGAHMVMVETPTGKHGILKDGTICKVLDYHAIH